MDVQVREEPIAGLGQYARVPIAFEVREVLDLVVRDGGLGGFALVERPLDVPWMKNYDDYAGERPSRWAIRFDVSRWGLLTAHAEGRPVGGAVVAFNTPGVDMLEGRRDLAVLWDLRVAPEMRGRGVGAALFGAAEAWAVARECRQLKVETQNINVPACRFYARQGCVLGVINRFAYPTLPDEVQLLWYKDLPSAIGVDAAASTSTT
ncbi:MAG TPA: GNAT family N-acetyltransferase [Longimicrobium sp.]|jgi:GNAT superfamily N-acetyltransferase|uniref:GNAT family N-acetyltransferase n=1 Tax=Longimicrobium sp. TaxID=2029185 RepID=UPI002EDB74F9